MNDKRVFREVLIKNLDLPGDLKKLLDEPRIIDRADSIHRHGCIDPIKVRKSDMKLIAGRDRVAAHMKLGLDKIWAELGDWDDEEARSLDAHSNIERRHDQVEQRRLIAERVMEIAKKIKEEKPTMRVRGRRGVLTAIGEAQRVVAKEHGMKTDTVRKIVDRATAKRRAKKKADAAGDAAPETLVGENGQSPPAEPIFKFEFDCFGLPRDEAWLQQVAEVDSRLREAARLTQLALTQLTKLGELPVQAAQLQRARQDAQSLGAIIRGMRPSRMCPYCKRWPGHPGDCSACTGSGYVTVARDTNIPKELEKADRVAVGGKFVTVTPPEAPKRKRAMSFE